MPNPSQSALSPPKTATAVSKSFSLPGSTVVTLMLNGENFSAVRAQISLMEVSSTALKESGDVASRSNAGVGGTSMPGSQFGIACVPVEVEEELHRRAGRLLRTGTAVSGLSVGSLRDREEQAALALAP